MTTLYVEQDFLSLEVLKLNNVSWEQTRLVLERSPHLRVFKVDQWPQSSCSDGEVPTDLATIFQQLATSNPLLESLRIETAWLPQSELGQQRPQLTYLRDLRICKLDLFNLLVAAEDLEDLLPSCPLLKEVTFEVFTFLDSDDKAETEGLIQSMNSFLVLQREFPKVTFQLEKIDA